MLQRKYSSDLKAVFNPKQLEKFCRMFRVKPSELNVNFNGWHKYVILAKDKVFLIPRSPEYEQETKKELSVYEQFSHLNSVPLPKLIKRVNDKEISWYEFGAVTRLSGIPFSALERKIKSKQLEKVLSNLFKTVAVWHNIPINSIPKIVSRPKKKVAKRVTIENWHEKALNPVTTKESIDFIYRLVKEHDKSSHISFNEDIKQKWLSVIKEIASLNDVLVHADIHEEQILVNPKTLEITGVLDWEDAKIDNPIWDFHFGEWGLEIWRWSNDFVNIRKTIWSKYLKERNIELSTPHGLHLFMTLFEIIWIFKQREKEKIPLTNANFNDSMKIYIRKLNEATKLITDHISHAKKII